MSFYQEEKKGCSFFMVLDGVGIFSILLILSFLLSMGAARAPKAELARKIYRELYAIDGALKKLAQDQKLSAGSTVSFKDYQKYLPAKYKALSQEGKDRLGNFYGKQLVGQWPKVSVETRATLAPYFLDSYWNTPFEK